MDDGTISELLEKRSGEALKHIDEKYGALIKKLISNILKDPQDIEEAVNDTYQSIWESSGNTPPVFLTAYVCRIAKNVALKKARYNSASKRAPQRSSSVDELAEILPGVQSTESEFEEKLLTGIINEFLEEQPVQKRAVFVKRYWFYESVEEIAEETGMKSNAVAAMLFRMRRGLKDKLKEEGWFYD